MIIGALPAQKQLQAVNWNSRHAFKDAVLTHAAFRLLSRKQQLEEELQFVLRLRLLHWRQWRRRG